MPYGRRRWLLLALLALAIPLPALGLSGSRETTPAPAPVALAVSTSLDSCGIADSQVVCKLDVSFNAIPGATSYTASVTRADGSVVDYGGVGAGGGSLWVPYTGSGGYSVRISAYGTPPAAESEGAEESGNELITSEASEAKDVKPQAAGNSLPAEDPGARGGDGEPHAGNATHAGDPGADPNAPATAPSSCAPQPEPAPVPEEELPEPPPPDLDPENPDEDGDGIDDAEERAAFELALSQRTAAALEAQAQLPDAINCGEPATP
jgi:hypothetical protein